jgi:hypothetical protein
LFPGEVGGGVAGPVRAELAAAVGSSSVVVGLVLGQDQSQASLCEDHQPVGDLGPVGEHEPSAQAFARGLEGGILTAWMPVLARAASNDAVNWPVRSWHCSLPPVSAIGDRRSLR